MPEKLTSWEQETIINFNKEEPLASIFTYEKTWQQHLEKRLGLKPTREDGFGGKEYVLPKSRIKPPRAPIKLSDSAKGKLAERLRGLGRPVKAPFCSQKPYAVGRTGARKQNKAERDERDAAQGLSAVWRGYLRA